MKPCTVCKVDKPIQEFNSRSQSPDGHRAECRDCQRAAYRKAKAKDPDAHNAAANARKQKWRADGGGKRSYARHRDKERARGKRRREKNLDAMRAKARAKYLLDPAKQREATLRWLQKRPDYNAQYARAHYEAHKAKYFERARKRRALKRAATIVPFTLAELDARMSVFGHRCAYCGGPFEHVDHVKPLSKGGPHCLANLRPSCKRCNLQKFAKHPLVWFRRAS